MAAERGEKDDESDEYIRELESIAKKAIKRNAAVFQRLAEI